jgi:hypothetical protein
MFESTDVNIGDKPRNSRIPPSGLPAPGGPGHWGTKPRNSIIPPGGKPAPGGPGHVDSVFHLKPVNSPVPPAGKPSPGGNQAPAVFDRKPVNTPIPPAGKPSPGGNQSPAFVDKKPVNSPVPPAGKPSPGGNLVVPPASFTILNNMVAGISVHCYDQLQDVPSAVISPGGPAFTVNFQEDTTNDLPWLCEFKDVANTGSQSIIVWTHDGKSTPYLSE